MVHLTLSASQPDLSRDGWVADSATGFSRESFGRGALRGSRVRSGSAGLWEAAAQGPQFDDITVEPLETFVLTMVTGSGYALGSAASASGTITDNDGAAAKMASTSTSSSSTSLTSTDTALTSTDTSLTSTGTAPGKSQFCATAV